MKRKNFKEYIKKLKKGFHSTTLLNLNSMIKELSYQGKIDIINLRLRLIESAVHGMIKMKLSEKNKIFTVETVEGNMTTRTGYIGTINQVLIYSMASNDGICAFREYLKHVV